MNYLSRSEFRISLRQSLSFALTVSVALMAAYVVFEPVVYHSFTSLCHTSF